MRKLNWCVLALCVHVIACGGTKTTDATDAGADGATDAGVVHPARLTMFGVDAGRPVTLSVPEHYNNNDPTPLVMLLHGYSASGEEQALYFGFDQLANEDGVLFLAPNGLVDQLGNQYWNATDACCDFYHTGVDDVGYLTGLINEISAEYNVDPKRVYVTGHSNGGFMSYRMACDRSDLVASIMVLAGATWLDTTKCTPQVPVSVLELHGNADTVISYDGGELEGVGYPGSLQNMADWQTYNGCTGMLQAPGAMFSIGAEVSPQTMSGCPAGLDMELWTLPGSGHIPNLDSTFHSQIWKWLEAHPKP